MHLSAAEWALAGLFAVWLALSVALQGGAAGSRPGARLVRRVRRYDVLGLVPAYRFFAPVPRPLDYRLAFRTAPDGSWHVLATATPRSWRTAFWNPDQQVASAFANVAGRLAQVVERKGVEAARTSLAHGLLLAHVRRAAGSGPLQFRLLSGMEWDAGAPETLVFQSGWHGESAWHGSSGRPGPVA